MIEIMTVTRIFPMRLLPTVMTHVPTSTFIPLPAHLPAESHAPFQLKAGRSLDGRQDRVGRKLVISWSWVPLDAHPRGKEPSQIIESKSPEKPCYLASFMGLGLRLT